ERLVAVVQVPAVLTRFVQLPSETGIRGQGSGVRPDLNGMPAVGSGVVPSTPTPAVFVPLETVIRMHLPELFPGMEFEGATVFRVTRNSDYEIDDDEVEDLLKAIEEEVRKRRRGAASRLEIEAGAPPEIAQFLIAPTALDLDPGDVYHIPGLLDL